MLRLACTDATLVTDRLSVVLARIASVMFLAKASYLLQAVQLVTVTFTSSAALQISSLVLKNIRLVSWSMRVCKEREETV